MANNTGKKWGGRAKGTPNKATAEIKDVARIHAPEAMKVLVSLLKKSKSEQVKVAAAREILDRAYGKATQTIDAKVKHVGDIRSLSTDELLAQAASLGIIGQEERDGEAGSLH